MKDKRLKRCSHLLTGVVSQLSIDKDLLRTMFHNRVGLGLIAFSLFAWTLQAQVTGVVRPENQQGGQTATASNGILYHGGPIIVNPHVYFIWYGNWSGDTALTILPQFITGLSGSPYFNIDSTYTNGGGQSVVNNIGFGPQVFDNYSQ